MSEVGRFITLAGVVLVVLGLALWGLGKTGFRGLPGDLRYESDHVSVYFPIVTCLVLSVVATLAFWLWQWLGRR